MKKILLPSAAVIGGILTLIASLFGEKLISITAFSIIPFALFFITAIAGTGDMRFKDDEDDKLTKDECSLPIKEVARIRHNRGLARLIGCRPEIFFIFFFGGILKAVLSLVAFILSALLASLVYAADMKKAQKNKN